LPPNALANVEEMRQTYDYDLDTNDPDTNNPATTTDTAATSLYHKIETVRLSSTA